MKKTKESLKSLLKDHIEKQDSAIQEVRDRQSRDMDEEDDSVGGLEIMDQTGTFVPVHPVTDSFLINLGDIGKVWSNGRLQNLKHRVQCKEAVERISIALFLLGPKNAPVKPPQELVDSHHPRLYKSITVENYRQLRLSTGSRAGESLSHLLL
ncbi:putative oxoglutarate/iron-dependent dioxygenase, isopenicillin N synthase [Dioscorea sansibarensis]